MSDVGSDVEDFETSKAPQKRKKVAADDDDDAAGAAVVEHVEKKSKADLATTAGATNEEGAEEEDGVGEARRGEEPPPSFVRPDNVLDHEKKTDAGGQMYTKTMNVKDICSIITGCCSVPGVEAVLLTFSPQGLEFYTKPAKISPVCVSAFYSKSNFCTYNVTDTVKHVVHKAELDDLKKRVAKDVEFLEITDGSDGFVVGGRRTYKTGSSCDFKINMTSMDETTLSVTDMSNLRWNLQVRTASQHFADNVAFFDDQVKWIQLAVKPKLLEFSGIRDTGSRSKQVNQMITSEFTGEYKALFNKKVLKGVTAARDINRALCISFNISENDFPVHFMYEMGQDQPQSHFSVYIAPCNAEDRD